MHKNDICQDANTNCSTFKALGNSSSDKSYSGTNVYTSGGHPYNDTFEWARHSGDRPRVVDFELEPISKLFITKWFQAIPFLNATLEHHVEAKIIKDYFEDNILNGYCKLMLGDECPPGDWKSNLGPKIEILAFLQKSHICNPCNNQENFWVSSP